MSLFVALLKRDTFADPPKQIDCELLPPVIDLATRYNCHTVKQYIILLLLPNSDFVPRWTLFLAAARLDCETLAKRAIGRLNVEDYDWTGNGQDDDELYEAGIDSRYVVALTRATTRCWSGKHTVEYRHTYTDPITVPVVPLNPYAYKPPEKFIPPDVAGTKRRNVSITAEAIAAMFSVRRKAASSKPAALQHEGQAGKTSRGWSL